MTARKLSISVPPEVEETIVVTIAIQRQAPVVTSDPDDLTHLADSIGVKLRLFTV